MNGKYFLIAENKGFPTLLFQEHITTNKYFKRYLLISLKG